MDVSKFTIGRSVRIKTDDDIYDSYISAITLSDENFVYFKSGSLRITLLDKLKSDKNETGNKLDVTGGTIKGDLTVNKQIYMGENKVLSFVVLEDNNGYLIDENGNKYYPEIKDTGWKKLELTESFKAYGGDENYSPKIRKIGKLVEITGAISPTSELKANAYVSIATIPEEYRPSINRTYLIVGAGISSINKYSWVCEVFANGNLRFDRFGTEQAVVTPTSAWLPFNIMYFVD